MNNKRDTPSIKKFVKVSVLLEDIKKDIDAMKNEIPDFNGDFYDDAEVERILNFLAVQHKDEWILIDDRYD